MFLNEKTKIVWDSVFVVKSLLLKSLHVFKSGFAFLICIASSVNSFFFGFSTIYNFPQDYIAEIGALLVSLLSSVSQF